MKTPHLIVENHTTAVIPPISFDQVTFKILSFVWLSSNTRTHTLVNISVVFGFNSPRYIYLPTIAPLRWCSGGAFASHAGDPAWNWGWWQLLLLKLCFHLHEFTSGIIYWIVSSFTVALNLSISLFIYLFYLLGEIFLLLLGISNSHLFYLFDSMVTRFSRCSSLSTALLFTN